VGGVCGAVPARASEAVDALLVRHFPRTNGIGAAYSNELPDAPDVR
jgi:hypothetical protein